MNKKRIVEIHHHEVTDDPACAFLTSKKLISFRHKKYGPQNVRMTPRLWQIVLDGGLEALCREFDRMFEESPTKRLT